MPRSRRVIAFQLGIAGLVLLTGSGGSCSESEREETTPTAIGEPGLGEPDLRVLILTDLDGYLEPCGCTSRPLGGIDRMAHRVTALRNEGAPTVLVSAGNLLFHGAPHGGDAERAAAQERLRAESLLEILDRLDLTAATPGPLDFGFGTQAWSALAADASFPILAAGAAVTGTDHLSASTLHRAGALQIGIVGVANLESDDGALPDGVTADDPRAAARAAVSQLRADGADLIIALVTGDRRAARRIATGVDGLDVVVHGGLDLAEVDPPVTTDGAPIITAGRQGQGLVVLDLHRRSGADGWTDASVWTRESRTEHLAQSIAALEARIEEWERDSELEASDVASQRSRLSRMRGEAAALRRPPTIAGSAFTARYIELPPEAAQDRRVTELMSALDRRINDHNRTAFAEWLPEDAADGQPHYIGSQACSGCHEEELTWWRGHAHGRAYATLETRNKNFNLSCVGCHVTGYLRPGGSTVTHVERLQDVGCESCHGPSSQHVLDPTGAAVNVTLDPPESLCRSCHNPDHSDRFDFDMYRRMIVVPGHGR